MTMIIPLMATARTLTRAIATSANDGYRISLGPPHEKLRRDWRLSFVRNTERHRALSAFQDRPERKPQRSGCCRYSEGLGGFEIDEQVDLGRLRRWQSVFLTGLGFVALRRWVAGLATRRAALRGLFLRELARDHRDHCAVHRVDHQQVIVELDEAILLEHRLLVDQWRRHHIELELGRDLLANLGLKLVRRLLGAVRGHQRVLNFATLLVAELQWRLLLRGSGEFVRLNRRIGVLRRCRHRQQSQGRAATEQGFHGRSPGSAGTTVSSPKRSLPCATDMWTYGQNRGHKQRRAEKWYCNMRP
jgi:hypothetical protein